MSYCPPSVVLRALLAVLLVAGLGSCGIFHPYRLPTPKPSPEFRAQQKAAGQARKAQQQPAPLFRKKSTAGPGEAATDVSSPTGGPMGATGTAAPAVRTLPEHTTVQYDKAGLMKKKPKLIRRRIHKPSKPFRPWRFIRNFFKHGFDAKPNYSPDHRPAAPASVLSPDTLPDEVLPGAAPGAAPGVAPAGKP